MSSWMEGGRTSPLNRWCPCAAMVLICSLSLISPAFVPLASVPGPYAALLLISVGTQEGLRLFVHWLHR